jgi:hypothetical protein
MIWLSLHLRRLLFNKIRALQKAVRGAAPFLASDHLSASAAVNGIIELDGAFGI